MIAKLEASVLERLVDPAGAEFDALTARALLRLRLPDRDAARLRELMELHRTGVATHEQEAELEAYDRVGTLLSILQSKCRLALKRHGEAP